ncbi:MAG: hypothetical protein P4L31_03240 [Candidatus Babeliales bacterium]|nr:hypothetical protein [Candidatus Babeliales bacterium]
MNTSYKLTLATLLAISTTGASADVNFGFSLGLPAPVYSVYAPAPVYVQAPVYVRAPIVRRVYVPQPAPQVGFSVGTPDFGFNINVPLTTPKAIRRDTQGHSYWEVYNNTDVTVKFINNNGDRVIIPSGCSKNVSHKDSLTFTVLGDGQRFRAKSSNHFLVVEFDENEILKVYSE